MNEITELEMQWLKKIKNTHEELESLIPVMKEETRWFGEHVLQIAEKLNADEKENPIYKIAAFNLEYVIDHLTAIKNTMLKIHKMHDDKGYFSETNPHPLRDLIDKYFGPFKDNEARRAFLNRLQDYPQERMEAYENEKTN